jgi:sec-independent protein translocase protein TatC
MPRLRAVDFEDRLTLTEHLGELRMRLVVCLAAIGLGFALCFWQNDLLLNLANDPLPQGRVPLTFGPTEPFTVTLSLSVYGALVLAFPVILWQAYAFVLPAFSPEERRIALPLLLMVPVLFAAGVLFAYFVALPAAMKFLLNFNEDQFNIQLRAREYYGFFGLTLLSVGALFQMPLGVLAVTRMGIVTPKQLARNRPYAVLVIAIVAAFLPGTDPITMMILMLPLLALYEFSILLARAFGRRAERIDAEVRATEAR